MKQWLFSCLICMHVFCAQALEISVGEGEVAAKPIAVVPFAGNVGFDKVDFIIASDLRQSGVFSPIDPSGFAMRPSTASSVDYNAFQRVGAAYIVGGNQTADGVINYFIADVFQQKVIGTFSVPILQYGIRQTAHKISDQILQQLTGVRGAFATRLVYVYETGYGPAKKYYLMLSDSDGQNPVQLLSSSEPLMSPRFSPDGKMVAYVTFEGKQPQIVTHDIFTGRRSLVSKQPGMNASPSWSPDGSKIAMVLSRDGNPEVYYKDLVSGALRRVTNNAAIDSQPIWSADGQSLYFSSNRSGTAELYSIDIFTGALSQLTSAGSYSVVSDSSRDGKRLALTKGVAGTFSVGTMDVNNGAFQAVSSGAADETPRFSANDKMLIYSTIQGGRSVLKIVNIDGSGDNVLSAAGHMRDADWSTYIR